MLLLVAFWDLALYFYLYFEFRVILLVELWDLFPLLSFTVLFLRVLIFALWDHALYFYLYFQFRVILIVGLWDLVLCFYLSGFEAYESMFFAYLLVGSSGIY